MENLEITTFGTVGVRVGDRDIPALSGTKLGLLLAYLAAEAPRRIPREELARLFWPDLTPKGARVNLRQGLFQLRRLLHRHPALLETTPRHVHFEIQPAFQIDCIELQHAHTECEDSEPIAHATHVLHQLRRYHAPFLQSVQVLQDLPELSVWARERREYYWKLLLGLPEHYLDDVLATGAGKELLSELHRLLILETHDERLHRLLMLTLEGLGHREQALEHVAHLHTLDPITPDGLLARTRDEILARRNREADPREPPGLVLRSERRQVTVVACRLQPDPGLDVEQQQACIEHMIEHLDLVLLNHRGHVVRSAGSGLLAYFGYPAGRENAVVDAVQAAWKALQTASPMCPLRLAVDTGLIVTGTHSELPDPAGQLSQQALELARSASTGTLLVSHATHARVSGYFSFAPNPNPDSAAVTDAWQVIGNPGPLDRIDAQRAGGLTPLAGRQVEQARLQAAWKKTCIENRARFTLIQGEAGVGKSRLARELAQQVRGITRSCILLKCREDRSRHLLAPIRQAFSTWIGSHPIAASRQCRLARSLARLESMNTAMAEDLACWLTQPDNTGTDTLATTGMDRNQIIDLLVELLEQRTRHGPTLILCDDAHWMDSGTAEFLRRAHHRLLQRPFMALLTARMSFRSIWRDVPLDHLRLHSLSPASALDLVQQLDPEHRLSTSLREHLVQNGEGNPLYLEELTRHTLETAHTEPLPPHLPPGLSNLLAARLELLGSARDLACAAAIIGRDFDTHSLSRLLEQPSDSIRRQLAWLTWKGFIEPVGVFDGVRYRFRHALFHQAAYEALLLRERRRLHGRLEVLLRETPQHDHSAPSTKTGSRLIHTRPDALFGRIRPRGAS